MVVLDEKQVQLIAGNNNAPPPYPGLPSVDIPDDAAAVDQIDDTDTSSPPLPIEPWTPATFSSLPSYILLYIVHHTMPPDSLSTAARTRASLVERRRKVLYWITICLRCVNRAFYVGE